jgi:hypothetical protein
MTTGTDMPAALPAPDARFLSELAQQLRADSIRCSSRRHLRVAHRGRPPANWSRTEGMEAHDGY